MAVHSIPYAHNETLQGWRKFLCIPKAVLKELNMRELSKPDEILKM